MKLSSLLMISALLAAQARADDPPPLPPNPFANLPAGNDGGFSPFEDDFDDGEGGADAAPSSARPGARPPMAATGGRPARPGSATPLNGGGINASAGSQRVDPANCKDAVENFDYPDAEILDVAKAIAKLTGKNLIFNPQDIKGRISLVSQTPITVCDAWNAFLTALNMKNFALVPSGKYLRIERIASAKEKQTPIYANKKPQNNDEFITRVVPLRYIDAVEFEQAFRLWMPREARMQAYSQTNTVIITDTAAHINRMVELINLLDVAGYQESLVVVPVRNSVAKDIARLIEQILNENRSSTTGSFGAPARPTISNNTARTGGRGRSGGSKISKIIADDRTNSLIVKANAAGILEIRALLRRLDTKVAATEGSGRLHVIRLQFADAETLAKTLQQITGGGTGQQRSTARPFPAFGDTATVFQGDIKVAADKTTQSLVITASPGDFATFKKVVESLDVPRDQVFIEAVILEMKLNRDNSFGTSFINAPNGIALPAASGALTNVLAGNPLALGGFALGFKKGAERQFKVGESTFNVNSLNGLIELIQGNTDTNVVATPQIVALDNEEAIFEISEEIKIPTESTASNGTISRSYSSDKAQIYLKVKPQINKGSNFVKLDIDQKLENFDSANVPSGLVTQVKGKNIRATNTKVIVQNEDTVVLSGLIRDSVEDKTSKVPLLGDIPVLGWLFKNTQSTVRKTNLLVFITPRIIKQYGMMRKVLDRRLDEREDFIRENIGSKDPYARRISQMKKELPDLTVIEPLPQGKRADSASFSSPSSPEREYEDDYYNNPDNFYYPPDGVGAVPLPPIDGANPSFNEVPGDGQSQGVVLPPSPDVMPIEPME